MREDGGENGATSPRIWIIAGEYRKNDRGIYEQLQDQSWEGVESRVMLKER